MKGRFSISKTGVLLLLLFPPLVLSCSGTRQDTETVYITRTGSRYHRGDCSYLGKSKISIALEKAVDQGYVPCKKCDPPRMPE